MLSGDKIAQRIEKLIEQMGVKKTRLGEVLGVGKESTKQWKYYKLNSFLNNLKKDKVIDLKNLEKLGHFFDKPVEYFLDRNCLAQETKTYYTSPKSEHLNLTNFIQIPFIGKITLDKLKNISQSRSINKIPIHREKLELNKRYIIATGITCAKLNLKSKDEVLICLDCKPAEGNLFVFRWDEKISAGHYYQNTKHIQIENSDQDIPPITKKSENFQTLGTIISITHNIL